MPLRDSDNQVVVADPGVVRRTAIAVGHPQADTDISSIEDPARLRSFFERWARLGPDIFLAPTQRATPFGLKSVGAAQQCFHVNRTAIETLQGVAATMSRPALVAAQLGALSTCADEMARLEFDEAYIQYHEQVKPLAIAGPDLVVIRGIDDLRILRAALVALRELWCGPAVAVLKPDVVMGSHESSGPACALADVFDIVHHFGIAGLGFSKEETGEIPDVSFAAIRDEGLESVLDLGTAADAEIVHELAVGRGAGVELLLVEADPSQGVPLEPDKERAPNILLGASPLEDQLVAYSREILALAPSTPWSESILGELREIIESVGDTTERRPYVGVTAGAEPLDDRVGLFDEIEKSSGCALGVEGSTSRVHEACAKAARRVPLLVFSGPDVDVESALYLARRYGARAVLQLPATALATATGLRDEIESHAHGMTIPKGCLYVDVTPTSTGDSNDSAQGAALEALFERVREAGFRPAVSSTVDEVEAYAAADLIIVRVAGQ